MFDQALEANEVEDVTTVDVLSQIGDLQLAFIGGGIGTVTVA